jgi:hypothetical protein
LDKLNNLDSKLLFPHKFRIVGLFLLVLGLILGIVRFYYGIKPSFLDLKVFAIYSKFLETKYFEIISNHFTEEFGGILIIIGLLFIVFAKEKIEDKSIDSIRLQSLVISVYLNSIFILLSLLFIFGIGFVGVLIINMYSFLIIYLITFRIKIIRYKNIIK